MRGVPAESVDRAHVLRIGTEKNPAILWQRAESELNAFNSTMGVASVWICITVQRLYVYSFRQIVQSSYPFGGKSYHSWCVSDR